MYLPVPFPTSFSVYHFYFIFPPIRLFSFYEFYEFIECVALAVVLAIFILLRVHRRTHRTQKYERDVDIFGKNRLRGADAFNHVR